MHTWLGHGIDQSDLKLVLFMQALRNTFDSTNSELDASALDLTRSGTTAVLSIVTSDWCGPYFCFSSPHCNVHQLSASEVWCAIHLCPHLLRVSTSLFAWEHCSAQSVCFDLCAAKSTSN